VTHAEKVTSEVVYGQEYSVWDLHTDQAEWWVVTHLTNLYDKNTFPSVDMLLSFHVGFAARLSSRSSAAEDADDPDVLRTYRRLDVTAEALDEATEAEDYQAVAVRCREALLSLIRDLADPKMLVRDQAEPKLADFIHWSEVIADWSTPNPSLARIRSYLRSIAKDAWQLVNWLTHSRSANRRLADFAYRTTSHVVLSFSSARHFRNEVEVKRCPRCDSYQLFEEFRPDDWVEVTLCEACGAESPPRPIQPPRPRGRDDG
jgi:hypothetical protein